MEKDERERDIVCEMGRAAFHRGIRAPVLDERFMQFLDSRSLGAEIGVSLPLLRAWNKGWTEELLRDDVPNDTAKGDRAMDIRTINTDPDRQEYRRIPTHLLEGLADYAEKGVPPGGFLTSVLENDLRRACDKADLDSRRCLPDLVRLVFNHLPAGCWGSPAKVEQWILEKHPQEVPARIVSLFGLRRTADRLSDPDRIGPYMDEDASTTIENIADEVIQRVEDPLSMANSDPAARDLFFDQAVWGGEMGDEGFSAAAVYRQILRRAVETQIESKVTAHVGNTLFVEDEESIEPTL